MIVHNQVQTRNQTSGWPFWILTKLYPTLEDLTGPHPNPQRNHALCFSSVWIGQSPQMQTWGMGKMMQNIFTGAKKKKWVFALKGNFLWLEVVGFSVFVSYESEDEENLELSYIADANVKGCSRFGKQLGSFSQC